MKRLFSCFSLTMLVLLGGKEPAAAKPADGREAKWEFMVSSGLFAPAGAQQGGVSLGELTTAQLSYVSRPGLAFNGSFGWARSRDASIAGTPKIDLFTYDIGAEFRSYRLDIGRGTTFRPFLGAGTGALTYSYRNLPVDPITFPSAYISVGGELGYRRLQLKLEARDYLSGFAPQTAQGTSRFANNVTLMLGLRLVPG